MKQALLAWEHGGGRGHVLELAAVARHLAGRYELHAALCKTQHAGELAPLCKSTIQGAGLRLDSSRRTGPDRIPTASWGDFLADLGFGDPQALLFRLLWWQQCLERTGAELLIANCAPTAMLAARAMGIRTIACGNGYMTPPAGFSGYPLVVPEHGRLLHDEAATLAAVNAAGGALGMAPLAHLPEIYACDRQIITSLPMLDPYRADRTAPHVVPIGVPRRGARPGDRLGDEVFVYFSDTATLGPEVIAGLTGSGLPVRAFVPGADDAGVAALAAGGVTVEPRALPMQIIVPRTRVFVNWGQHGSTCAALLSGIPQVAMPRHLEQDYYARVIETEGTGIRLAGPIVTAQALRTAISTALASEVLQDRAQAVANSLAITDPARPWSDMQALLADL